MSDEQKIPCLAFYIQPAWYHQEHRMHVPLPDNWNEMEPSTQEALAEELVKEWFYSQLEYGWELAKTYEDEIETSW